MSDKKNIKIKVKNQNTIEPLKKFLNNSTISKNKLPRLFLKNKIHLLNNIFYVKKNINFSTKSDLKM